MQNGFLTDPLVHNLLHDPEEPPNNSIILISISILLVIVSGLCAGLTLGLLSIDRYWSVCLLE